MTTTLPACRTCKRPMRPHHTTTTDYPGTVITAYAGQCNSCRRRELRGNTGPARTPPDPDVITENVEFLLHEAGEHPDRIPARVGYTNPKSLAQLLRRHGHPQLAALFDRRTTAA